MDLSLPAPKRQKHLDYSGVGHGVDRISGLPGEVLCHKFSFLPTKDVVRTSMLSKRWQHLWTSAPNVDFSDVFKCEAKEYRTKVSQFKDFVDNVLFHHGGSTINKCFLQCLSTYASPHIYAWSCAVLSCNIRELTIVSSLFPFTELPRVLFTCKSLVSLKIKGTFVINLPNYICLPNLKRLHLGYVVYVDDSTMQRLFSSCPVLEELYLSRLEGDGVLISNILVPSLRRLTLIVPYLEFIAGHDYKTNIDAPYLEYLEIDDSMSEDYAVNFLASLVEVHIHGICVPVLLKEISHVKLLALSGSAMLMLVSFPRTLLPKFHNLSRLELGVNHNVGWRLLSDLLNNSPNLEALVFTEGLVQPRKRCDTFYAFRWESPLCVPECLLLHMKKIEVHNFAGTRSEMFLLRYLLEHALVLEEMMVHWYKFHFEQRARKHLSDVLDAMLSMKRGSANCKIEFVMEM